MPGYGGHGSGIEGQIGFALAASRVALAASIWAAPGPALRALGFDPGHPPALTLARLTATRDLATGLLALRAHGNGADARRMLLVNAAIDAGDTLAFSLALAGRDPALRRAGAVGAPGALAACLTGFALARRLRGA
jgi:hypothetical protein